MRRGGPVGTRRLFVALVIGLVSLLGDVPRAVTAPIVSSVSLPSAFALSQVFVAGGQLVLTGSQYSALRLGHDLLRSRVNPSSLKMSRARLTSCDNVVLDGATVAPFVSTVKVGYGELRIGRLDSRAGAVKLGPGPRELSVRLRHRPRMGLRAGFSLDLRGRDCSRPKSLRVSSTTGQLLQSTPVPGFVRPLITADANGLYVVGRGDSAGPAAC